MGGTFDPVHHGHLSAASEVAARFALDEVVFVPTGRPWQKSDTVGEPGRGPLPHDGDRDRQQPAVLGQPHRGRPARARRTRSTRCARCTRRTRDAELFFITGADALAQILGWHAADELFALAHFVGVSRPGYERVDLSRFPDGAVTLLEVPALAISSTDCRARVGRGRPRLVPRAGRGRAVHLQARALPVSGDVRRGAPPGAPARAGAAAPPCCWRVLLLVALAVAVWLALDAPDTTRARLSAGG